ncbi:SDR family NAD(P)-dependent oxidoreductase [Paraburkholderia xenovorans]|uniref:SDR family NAD(P)-dependent oxidoreductase n=1 Tax=Paraburkholderia xenovorans TaxID=36873 RepID=UPI0038BE055A
MDLGLHGKRALVTGSSAGIGAETACVLAHEGASVVVHGLFKEEAEAVATKIKQAGGKAIAISGDLTKTEDIEQIARDATSAFGGIDILINNAGTYPISGWWKSSPENWMETDHLDVVSGIRLVQLLVPGMVERGWGRVIQLASTAAVPSGTANFFPQYASAKAAQLRAASALAVELTGTGVTSNAINPGAVGTETFLSLYRERAKAAGFSTDAEGIGRWFIQNYMPDLPLGRLLRPREIADMAAFLASSCSDAITGAEFCVDGGLAIHGFIRQISELPAIEASRARK